MKLSKLIITIVIIVFLFAFTSCYSITKGIVKMLEEYNSSAQQDNVIQYDVSLSTNNLNQDIFTDKVIALESEYIDLGDYSISIVGATFDKSKDEVFDDRDLVLNVVDDSFIDQGDLVCNIGMCEMTDKGFKKKDAYVCIYIDYVFDDESISQSDSTIPQFLISATDNKGYELCLIYNSHEHNCIDIDCTYGLIVFKGYYDSECFTITVNDYEYQLDTALLLE